MSRAEQLFWLVLGFVLLSLSSAPGRATQPQSSINPPTNFGGAVVSNTEILWSWNPVLGSTSTLGATHYELRETGTDLLMATIPASLDTPVTFLEGGLETGHTYSRHVRAVNGLTFSDSLDVGVTIAGAAVPCSIYGQGINVVKKGAKTVVKFVAVPGDGAFKVPPEDLSKKKRISLKVLTVSNVVMEVEVEGLEKSNEAGDAPFVVRYTCKDGTVTSVQWFMTVLGIENDDLLCQAIAIPPDSGSVFIASESIFTFRALSGDGEESDFTWTSVQDDGGKKDVNGVAVNGDLGTVVVPEIPALSGSVMVTATGEVVSKNLGDIVVLGKVSCSPKGNPGVVHGSAQARRQYTVEGGPTPSSCTWRVVGPSGIGIPKKDKDKKKTTVTLVFESTTHPVAPINQPLLTWTDLETKTLAPGISAKIVAGVNTARMTVEVTAGQDSTKSIISQDLVIRATYKCDENLATKTGSAVHAMTAYELLGP